MSTLSIEDAQERFGELIDHLAPGQEIILTRGTRVVAKLVGHREDEPRPRPVFGRGRGKIETLRDGDDDPVEPAVKIAMIDDLRRVAGELATDRLGRSQYKGRGTFSSTAVEKSFGTWNDAILAAGLTPLPQGGIPKSERQRVERLDRGPFPELGPYAASDDELLQELIRLKKLLGRRPSENQITARGKYPLVIYRRKWRTVKAAFERAVERFPNE